MYLHGNPLTEKQSVVIVVCEYECLHSGSTASWNSDCHGCVYLNAANFPHFTKKTFLYPLKNNTQQVISIISSSIPRI